MQSRKNNKSKNFTNNPFFRLAAPFLLGILVYFLVLLVFDTIDQLETNFFRAELILCLLISYLVFETNRVLIIVLGKKMAEESTLSKRAFIQVSLSSLLIILLTSAAVSFYMSQLVGFKSYRTELVVFNGLFLVLGWCLHAVYFSLMYLKKVADIQYNNEKSIRKAIEAKLESSLEELKPQFLNKCLETLIVLSYKNKDEADNYLEKVSDFYRGKLSLKNELINLKDEIETAENFVAIHAYWFEILINKEEAFNTSPKLMIVQGAIRLIIEYILNTAILLPNIPLHLFFDIRDGNLNLSSKISLKLKREEYLHNELDRLNSSYSFYTSKKIETVVNNGLFLAKIPLITAD